MGRLNELRLIARVAQMYHVEGKRQAELQQRVAGRIQRALEVLELTGQPLSTLQQQLEPAPFAFASEIKALQIWE